ncbi:unnamed protein product [Gadus morhua 'NCC']
MRVKVKSCDTGRPAARCAAAESERLIWVRVTRTAGPCGAAGAVKMNTQSKPMISFDQRSNQKNQRVLLSEPRTDLAPDGEEKQRSHGVPYRISVSHGCPPTSPPSCQPWNKEPRNERTLESSDAWLDCTVAIHP